jgi:hypothetical protein
MMPSASNIFSIHSLATSSVTAHLSSLFLKHLPQAVQPRMVLPANCTSSVSIPSTSSEEKTLLIKIAVLPSLRALPLKATTFILFSQLYLLSSLLERKTRCRLRVDSCRIEHGDLNVVLVDQQIDFRTTQNDSFRPSCNEVPDNPAEPLF